MKKWIWVLTVSAGLSGGLLPCSAAVAQQRERPSSTSAAEDAQNRQATPAETGRATVRGEMSREQMDYYRRSQQLRMASAILRQFEQEDIALLVDEAIRRLEVEEAKRKLAAEEARLKAEAAATAEAEKLRLAAETAARLKAAAEKQRLSRRGDQTDSLEASELSKSLQQLLEEVRQARKEIAELKTRIEELSAKVENKPTEADSEEIPALEIRTLPAPQQIEDQLKKRAEEARKLLESARQRQQKQQQTLPREMLEKAEPARRTRPAPQTASPILQELEKLKQRLEELREQPQSLPELPEEE